MSCLKGKAKFIRPVEEISHSADSDRTLGHTNYEDQYRMSVLPLRYSRNSLLIFALLLSYYFG